MVSPFTNVKYLTLYSVFRKFEPLLNEQLGNPNFVALQSDNLNCRKRLGFAGGKVIEINLRFDFACYKSMIKLSKLSIKRTSYCSMK